MKVTQKETKVKDSKKPKTESKAKTTAGKKAEKKLPEKTDKKAVAKNTEKAKVKMVSTEELAQFVGVDVRRIQQLTQDGIIKKDKKTGMYDFVRSVHSLLQFYRMKSDSRRSSASDEMKSAKERHEMAKAKLEELKLAEKEGELHKAEDIEKIMDALLSRLRINLLAIPMALAPLVQGIDNVLEIAEKIDERIRRAMDEVADLDLEKLVEKESLSAEDN